MLNRGKDRKGREDMIKKEAKGETVEKEERI